MSYLPSVAETIDAIKYEILRQHQTWGQQNHPSVPKKGEPAHGIPAERVAKIQCELARTNNRMTWAHILVEEVAEACCADSPQHMIEELVQVAAVAISWVDSIHRNELN